MHRPARGRVGLQAEVGQRRLDQPRGDRRRREPVRGQFDRELPGQGVHRPLAGVVEGVQRLGPGAVQRRGEQDPPAPLGRHRPPHHRLRHRDRRPDVQPEDEVEVLAGQVEERRLPVGAEVVHEHVDPAEAAHASATSSLGLAVRSGRPDVARAGCRGRPRPRAASSSGRSEVSDDRAPLAANAWATASPIPGCSRHQRRLARSSIGRRRVARSRFGLPTYDTDRRRAPRRRTAMCRPDDRGPRLFAPATTSRPVPARRAAGTVVLGGRPALAWVNIQTAADATARRAPRPVLGRRRAPVVPAAPAGRGSAADRPAGRGARRPGEGARHVRPGDRRVVAPLAAIPDDNPRTIINDGEVVPGGRAVVFGTKDVQFADPIAAPVPVHPRRQPADGARRRADCSNGKVFARRRRADPVRHRHAAEGGRPLPARRRRPGR